MVPANCVAFPQSAPAQLKILTARAATSATVSSDASDWIIISSFAQAVGLKRRAGAVDCRRPSLALEHGLKPRLGVEASNLLRDAGRCSWLIIGLVFLQVFTAAWA